MLRKDVKRIESVGREHFTSTLKANEASCKKRQSGEGFPNNRQTFEPFISGSVMEIATVPASARDAQPIINEVGGGADLRYIAIAAHPDSSSCSTSSRSSPYPFTCDMMGHITLVSVVRLKAFALPCPDSCLSVTSPTNRLPRQPTFYFALSGVTSTWHDKDPSGRLEPVQRTTRAPEAHAVVATGARRCGDGINRPT